MKRKMMTFAAIVATTMMLMAAVVPTYQYLEKPIATDLGVDASCWRVQQINLMMTGDDPTATIRMVGYKDFAAFKAGKAAFDEKEVVIHQIDQLTYYPAIFQEILGRVLLTEIFYGSEFKEMP